MREMIYGYSIHIWILFSICINLNKNDTYIDGYIAIFFKLKNFVLFCLYHAGFQPNRILKCVIRFNMAELDIIF